MRKILHVGTHKTATTSFQACLGNNRDMLARQGLVFPDLGDVGLSDGIGHHSLIALIAENPQKAERVSAKLIGQAERKTAGGGTLLVSSERCYRHVLRSAGGEGLFQRRQNFVQQLSKVFGEDTEIVIVIRRPDSFVESSYQETIKKGNRTDSIQMFWRTPGFGMRLDYASQIRLFQTAFRKIHVFIYEDLIQDPDGPETALLRGLGLTVSLDSPAVRQNVGLHPYFTEYKRLMNYQKFPPAQLRHLIQTLLEVQKEGGFGWMNQKWSFLGLPDRENLMREHSDGLGWIAHNYLDKNAEDMFPPVTQPSPVFDGIPAPVFEEIHSRVCHTLNGDKLFFS